MKEKIHFMKLSPCRNVTMMTLIGGQKLGRTPIREGALVTDKRGSTCVQNARAKHKIGDIFYTTTLKKGNGKYTATDIVALKDDDNVFLNAKIEYEKLLQNL